MAAREPATIQALAGLLNAEDEVLLGSVVQALLDIGGPARQAEEALAGVADDPAVPSYIRRNAASAVEKIRNAEEAPG